MLQPVRRGVVLQPRVPEAALAFERRQPQGPLQTGAEARGGRAGSCAGIIEFSRSCRTIYSRRHRGAGAPVPDMPRERGRPRRVRPVLQVRPALLRLHRDDGYRSKIVANCPTCRAPPAASAEETVERLLRLLARSPGRHTPVAQYNLGRMYEDGTGVKDHTEAVRLYRLAADQGYAKAQCNLGVMYTDGTGTRVPQDRTEAARWFRLAADQGDAYGQYNLGVMYKRGTGVPQDYVEAVRLLTLARDQRTPAGLRQPRQAPRAVYRRHPGPDRGPRCRRPPQRQARGRRPAAHAARHRP